MDPVTQTTLGAAIGQAYFRQRLGGWAVLVGAACGAAPDLDVVLGGSDPWFYLRHHRGITHSLVVLPVAAIVIAWVVRWWRGRGSFRDWYWLVCLALVTHPLLDLFTTYGTMLLAPLSSRRFSIEGVGILDPLVTVPLVIVAVWSARRDTKEERRRLAAKAALSWCCLYLAVGCVLSVRAASIGRAELAAAGFDVERLTTPVMLVLSPLRRIVASTPQGDVVNAVVNPLTGHMSVPVVHRALDDPSVSAVLESEVGEIFSWFANGYVAAYAEAGAESATREIVLSDRRYGFLSAPRSSVFEARFTVARAGGLATVQEASVHQLDTSQVSFFEELRAGWGVFLGGDGAGASGVTLGP